jgi:hypothetical protein
MIATAHSRYGCGQRTVVGKGEDRSRTYAKTENRRIFGALGAAVGEAWGQTNGGENRCSVPTLVVQ